MGEVLSLFEEVFPPGRPNFIPGIEVSTILEFEVLGVAKTAGSKRSFIPKKGDGSFVTRPDGRPMVVTKDDAGKGGEDWRGDVKRAFQDATPEGWEPLDEPVWVQFEFYRARPKGHYGTGRNEGVLKASAPLFPTTKPDTTKLQRAIEDALTKLAWRDDSIVVEASSSKFWAPDGIPKAIVRIGVFRPSDGLIS